MVVSVGPKNTRQFGVHTLGFISQALKGYTGHQAIASELIQNADDAQAAWISFHISRDMLIVRNGSVFSDKDWESICSIASGAKRQDEGKIGTFGTGFISVYHITDRPEVLSGGEHLVFDPRRSECPVFDTEIMDFTEIRLPWRTSVSEISEQIESSPWSTHRIVEFTEEITNAIYRLAIFLRYITDISVYAKLEDGQEKLLSRVKRHREHHATLPETGDHFEIWSIEFQRAGQSTRNDTWHYYQRTLSRDVDQKTLVVKDYQVALAFPLKHTDWLAEQLPATLYNFLPTEIRTGLGFQANGAFYPDNNRKGILDDFNTQEEKTRWNYRAVNAIGELFRDNILHIRDTLEESGLEPRRFYELLPITPVNKPYLSSIQEQFLQCAQQLPIVFTSLSDWRIPERVYQGIPGSGLPTLVRDYLPILAEGIPSGARLFLTSELDLPKLTWEIVLDFLLSHVRAGQPLAEAHPAINEIEKLTRLYIEFPSTRMEKIAGAPLFLDTNDTLQPANRLWFADDKIHELLEAFPIRFASNDVVALSEPTIAVRVKTFLNLYLATLTGGELVTWLNSHGVKAVSEWVSEQDDEWLRKLLKFIHQDIENVRPAELANLPLFIVEDDETTLFTAKGDAATAIYIENNAATRADLTPLGILFASPDWIRDQRIRAVYERAGISVLEPEHVAEIVGSYHGEIFAEREIWVQSLSALYSYFLRYRGKLSEDLIARLQGLPICLTQQDTLVAIKEVPLYLPATTDYTDQRVRTHLAKLELDYLVHDQLLQDVNNMRFLRDVLNVEPLTDFALINDIIIPNYHNKAWDHETRRDLLHYIRLVYTEQLDSSQRSELRQKIRRSAVLLSCDQCGGYRRPQEVYFASPELDAVFEGQYCYLHPLYQIPRAAVEDEDQTPYRSHEWYSFLRDVGVNEIARPEDMVEAVERAVADIPDEGRVAFVQRIYNRLSDSLQERNAIPSAYERLREIPWLPAQSHPGWHFPASIYQARDHDLVGSQAPALPRSFKEAQRAFRDFLGMPASPNGSLVARHLLDCAEHNRPVSGQVYARLGSNWNEVSEQLKRDLRSSAVLYEPNSGVYWKASHAFIGEHAALFGKRRLYIDPDISDINLQSFYKHLGVRSQPTLEDHFHLLAEIARSYRDGEPVEQEDLPTLHRNFTYLGQNLEDIDDGNADLQRLRQLRVVPDAEHCLRRPDKTVIVDRPDLRDYFAIDDFHTLDISDLSSDQIRFLKIIGVASLSESVRREKHRVVGPQPSEWSAKIHERGAAVSRIAYHEGISLPVSIDDIEVQSCSDLEVQYRLITPAGLQIDGQVTKEDALYIAADNSLYLRRTSSNSLLPLAQELKRMLFPENDAMIALIEKILELNPIAIDRYLDERQFRRLPGQIHEHEEYVANTEPAYAQIGVIGGASFADTVEQAEGLALEDGRTVSRELMAAAREVAGNIAPLSGQEARPAEKNAVPERAKVQPVREMERPPKPSQPDKQTTAPRFKGNKRAMGPSLANLPGELLETFGHIPQRTLDDLSETELHGLQEARDDAESNDIAEDTPESLDSGPQVPTVVRFTLTYANRMEGFLPLHSRAQAMLSDAPEALRCNTDFNDNPFELYIDRAQGVIHNREVLPKFFEAHLIPAGGVVYLERTHHDIVYLFWKSLPATVSDVPILDFDEKGQLVESMIPAVAVPCEVDEYVLKSEKRLEDPLALYVHSFGKRGVFQTICDVFGENGRELSFDEIYRGVTSDKKRLVASHTIRSELRRRPCFQEITPDVWRFDASLLAISLHLDSPNPSMEEAFGQQPASIVAHWTAMLIDISHELQSIAKGHDTRPEIASAKLRKVVDKLSALVEQVEGPSNRAVGNPEIRKLWDDYSVDPRQAQREALIGHLVKALQSDGWRTTLKILEELMEQTQQPERMSALLTETAKRLAQINDAEAKLMLYQLAHSYTAIDLTGEISHLEYEVALSDALAKGRELRWPERCAHWATLVQADSNNAALLTAVRDDILPVITSEVGVINEYVRQNKYQQAAEGAIVFYAAVGPLASVWMGTNAEKSLLHTLLLIAEQAVENRDYERALQLMAWYPVDARFSGSFDKYAHAVEQYAATTLGQRDPLAASALIDYLFYASKVWNSRIDELIVEGLKQLQSSLSRSRGVAGQTTLSRLVALQDGQHRTLVNSEILAEMIESTRQELG